MNKQIKNIVFLLLVLVTLVFGQYNEYEVKGLFLYRFAQYIEWPENSTVNDSTKPFIITVIGENPFGKILAERLAKIKIKGKKVLFEEVNLNNLKKCDLLFIPKSQKNNLTKIIKKTKGKGVVLVSDSEEFASRGVFINFYLKDNRVRFEINVSAAEKNGFKFSSRLLKQARIVE